MTSEKKRRARHEEITIKFVGSTKFKQELVDKVYEVLIDDDFQVKATRNGCGFTFNTSFPPSDEVMI